MRPHFIKKSSLVLAAVASAGLLAGLTGPAHADKIKHPTAVFAGLDKITGRIIAFDVAIDETVQFGSLQITPRVCYTRPQTEAPQTDGFVEVDELLDDKKFKRIFSGWMFAASPGLHGVEHPVYDVWLTDCKGEGALIRAPAQPKEEEPPPPNADVPTPDVAPKPKTTRRRVEPKTPPVLPPDIGAPPPAPIPEAPPRAPSRRYYPDVKVGPDPAGN